MEIEKGEWYFSVQCKTCEAPVYFSHDPSKGVVEISAREESVIEIICPTGDSTNEYNRDDLTSREAQ